MTKIEDDIVDLRAKISGVTSTVERMQNNLRIKDIHDQELDELKERVNFLEDKIAALQQIKAHEDITMPTKYPPYYPYTSPVPIESTFKPSEYQKFTNR